MATTIKQKWQDIKNWQAWVKDIRIVIVLFLRHAYGFEVFQNKMLRIKNETHTQKFFDQLGRKIKFHLRLQKFRPASDFPMICTTKRC